ncbi:MAG: DsrE family protein [Pseudomonadota bacterium]
MAFLINNAFGDDNMEKATVALVVGNAAAGKGDARIFLTHGGVDLALKGRTDAWHAEGYAPVKDLVEGYREKGGVLWVCKACADAKGISADDLIEGAEIAGAGHTMGFLEAGGQVLM